MESDLKMESLAGMDVLSIVEGTTFIISLLLVLSVLPLTYSMLTKRETAGMPFYTFLFSFCNAYIACLYGALINNRVILTLNSIGFVLHGLASLVYVMIARVDRVKSLAKVSFAVSLVMGIHYYTMTLAESSRQMFLGPIGLTTAVIMLSSPLMDVGHFIKQKSCEGMAVTMIVMSFLCCTSWTVYGHLLNDPYLYLPNLPGFLSAGVYFTLMFVYGFPEVKTKTA